MKTAAELIEEHVYAGIEDNLVKQNIPEGERESTRECWRSECMEEFRDNGELTGLGHRYRSRHYECDIVAAQIGDVWVAWPHWHGGGKHGCPEEIPWLTDAFYVDVKQETRVVNVFSRKEN